MNYLFTKVLTKFFNRKEHSPNNLVKVLNIINPTIIGTKPATSVVFVENKNKKFQQNSWKSNFLNKFIRSLREATDFNVSKY